MNQRQFRHLQWFNESIFIIFFVLDSLTAQVSFHSFSHSSLNVLIHLQRVHEIYWTFARHAIWRSIEFHHYHVTSTQIFVENFRSSDVGFQKIEIVNRVVWISIHIIVHVIVFFFVEYHVNATLNCSHVVYSIVFESFLIFDSFVYSELNLHHFEYIARSTALRLHHS